MNLRTRLTSPQSSDRTSLVKNCLRWSLISMAVSFGSKYEINYKLYVCSFIFVFLPFTVICEIRTILTYENFDEKMYPILYIAAQTLISCVLLFLYANRDGIRQLYDQCIDNEYVDDEFFRLCDQWCRRNLTVFALVLTLMASYTFLPFAIAFGEQIRLGSPLTFWYPATYPWRVDTLDRYAFTMIGQLFVAVPLTVTGFGFYLFIIQMRIIIRVHHRRLLDKIRTLDALWSQQSSHNHLKIVARNQLRSIVVYHQFLTKYVKKLESVITWPVNSWVVILFVGLIISLASLFSAHTNVLIQHNTLVFTLFGVFALLFLCYFCDELFFMNTSIVDNLYDTCWYDQSINVRRDLILFRCICQRPFRIKVFGANTINLRYIFMVVKHVYNALQVLLRTMKY